jgi:hypothetical protein
MSRFGTVRVRQGQVLTLLRTLGSRCSLSCLVLIGISNEGFRSTDCLPIDRFQAAVFVFLAVRMDTNRLRSDLSHDVASLVQRFSEEISPCAGFLRRVSAVPRGDYALVKSRRKKNSDLFVTGPQPDIQLGARCILSLKSAVVAVRLGKAGAGNRRTADNSRRGPFFCFARGPCSWRKTYDRRNLLGAASPESSLRIRDRAPRRAPVGLCSHPARPAQVTLGLVITARTPATIGPEFSRR